MVYNVRFLPDCAGDAIGIFGQNPSPFRVKLSLRVTRLARPFPSSRGVRSTGRADVDYGLLSSELRTMKSWNEFAVGTPS